MGAFEIRRTTLRELRGTRRTMLSGEWLFRIEKQNESTQAEAALALLKVQHAIRKLEDAELAELRDQLLANEAELAAGGAALEKALEKLNRVKDVLSAVSKFLKTVGKVVGLLG